MLGSFLPCLKTEVPIAVAWPVGVPCSGSWPSQPQPGGTRANTATCGVRTQKRVSGREPRWEDQQAWLKRNRPMLASLRSDFCRSWHSSRRDGRSEEHLPILDPIWILPWSQGRYEQSVCSPSSYLLRVAYRASGQEVHFRRFGQYLRTQVRYLYQGIS